MSNDFFFAENRAVCEITRENVVETDRPQMTMQYGACFLQEVMNTHKHSEHLILTLFPRQQLLRERASMLLSTYTAYLV